MNRRVVIAACILVSMLLLALGILSTRQGWAVLTPRYNLLLGSGAVMLIEKRPSQHFAKQYDFFRFPLSKHTKRW